MTPGPVTPGPVTPGPVTPGPLTPGAARPELCVGGIALDGDTILLVLRGRGPGAGRWSIPGGRVEAGETLAEALVREVQEETGMEGVCGELVGWVERISSSYHYVILDFIVNVLYPEDPVPADDAAKAAWVPLSEVAALPLVEGLAEFLHEHEILPTIA